jgi:hypothetical protein
MKARALFLCFLLARAMPCLAGGQQEAELSEAARLVEQQQYTEALTLLTRIQREKPELKELTEGLIKQIIIARTETYNKTLADFVHALYDAKDIEQAKVLYDKLSSLAPVPNPAQKTVLQNAREGISTIVNENGFQALMNNAAELLAARRYTEALAVYLLPLIDPQKAGLDLQRSAFEAAVSKLDQRSAQDGLARIIAAGQGTLEAAEAVRSVPQSIGEMLGSPLSAESFGRFDMTLAATRRLEGWEASVEAAGKALAVMNASVRGIDAKARKGPFLLYLSWLCLGRGNGKAPEGIAYAIHGIWEPTVAAVSVDVPRVASEAFSAAVSKFDAGDREGSVALFQNASVLGVLAVKASALGGGMLAPSRGWAFTAADRSRLRELIRQALSAQEGVAESAAFLTLVDFWREINGMPAARGTTPSQLSKSRDSLMELGARIEGAKKDWLGRSAGWSQKPVSSFAPASLSESARNVAGRFASLAQGEILERDLLYALELARIEGSGFSDRLSAAVLQKVKGSDLMHGTEGGNLPEAGVFKPRAPTEAIPVLDSAKSMLDALSGDIARYLTRWESDRSYTARGKRFTDVLAPVRGLLSRIEGAGGEKAQLDAMRVDAQRQKRSAVQKKNEADKAFDDAVALRRKDLVAAKVALGDARNLYLESLLLEENRPSRDRFENEIPALIRKINDDINARYIKEVDALVKEGRDQYNKGDYLKASVQLNKADARWKETQGDTPNADLDYWLATVRNALQVSGSRDLTPTDSRAPAVNNFISIANDRLTAAASAKKRKDAEWRRLLDEAVRNVDLALAAAPEYRVATLLKLKIDQLRDETSGAKNAQLQIEEYLRRARAILKQEPKAKDIQKEREVYFALRDYQELLGLYPELRAAAELKKSVAELPGVLIEIEIDLGIRTRPLTAAQLQDARAFFGNALKIYKKDDKRTYTLALNEIEKALAINPNFDEARARRTEILIQMGSAEVGILSKSDLARFYEAQDRFNGGDWPTAYTITRDLLDRGNNRNYPPLVELFERARRKVGL